MTWFDAKCHDPSPRETGPGPRSELTVPRLAIPRWMAATRFSAEAEACMRSQGERPVD